MKYFQLPQRAVIFCQWVTVLGRASMDPSFYFCHSIHKYVLIQSNLGIKTIFGSTGKKKWSV